MATSRSFSCVAGRYSRQTARKQNVIEPSICGEPLLFSGYTQPKAFVAVGSDLIAFLLVRGDATDIRHEHAGLAGNIGADIPRIGERIEGTVRHLVVVQHPGVFGVLFSLDACQAAIS